MKDWTKNDWFSFGTVVWCSLWFARALILGHPITMIVFMLLAVLNMSVWLWARNERAKYNRLIAERDEYRQRRVQDVRR